MKCCEISYKYQISYRNRLEKWIICARAQLANEHQCGINECKKEKEKLCTYVVAQNANC